MILVWECIVPFIVTFKVQFQLYYCNSDCVLSAVYLDCTSVLSKVNAGKSFILIKTRTTVIRILFVDELTMVRVFASKKPLINATTEKMRQAIPYQNPTHIGVRK